MIKISSLDAVKPMTNKVLVRILSRYTDEITIGETSLKLDTTFEPEMHTTAKGTIVKVCDKLSFGKEEYKMPWLTDIEVRQGDKVYFSWMAVNNAFERDGVILLLDNDVREDGKIPMYIIVDYAQLTVAVRGRDVIPLNGYCLVEPVAERDLPDEVKSIHSSLITEHADSRTSPTWGKVYKTGSPNKAYIPDIFADAEVSEGDYVTFQKNSDIPLQYDLHADFDGRRTFYKIQRRYMMAVIH